MSRPSAPARWCWAPPVSFRGIEQPHIGCRRASWQLFGAEAVDERVVIDRNRITGGGITAGIDFGLTVAAEVFGPQVAQEVQLVLGILPGASVQRRVSQDCAC